jgi:hypothetical protein
MYHSETVSPGKNYLRSAVYSLDLGLGRGKFSRHHGVVEPGSLVRAVAKRLIQGMTTPAEPDGSAPCQSEGLALGIYNLKIALHSDTSIAIDGYLSRSHPGLRKNESAPGTLRRTRFLEYAEFVGNSRNGPLFPLSILWHARIDFIRPGQDAALEIVNLAEAGFAQEIDGFRGALAAAAMRHDFA